MNSLSVMAREKLSTLPFWEKYASFADLAGNNGFVASKIALTHPHLQGFVADLPNVKNNFDSFVKQHGVSSNL